MDVQYEDVCKMWQQFGVRSAGDFEKYLDSFRVLFAYHSGKIENQNITYSDTREIFENGRITGYTGDLRTVFEMSNQKDCYAYLLPKLVERESLSIDLVRRVHLELAKGTYDERRYLINQEQPGEFKKHDYVTGIHEVGAYPEEVEADLIELLEEINDYRGGQALTAAAYFHAKFEEIHPFADGNGRVGRTLTNYYLMIHQHPPLVIHEEAKPLYIDCLRKFDETGDVDSLVRFFKYETEQTWGKTLERIKERAGLCEKESAVISKEESEIEL